MRIATESAHDHRVLLGPLQRRPVTGVAGELPEKLERTLLDREILAVLERQVAEPSLELVEAAIVACLDRALRQPERESVSRERAWRVAEHVARELVEQEDARQRAARSRAPRRESSAERGLDREAVLRAEPARIGKRARQQHRVLPGEEEQRVFERRTPTMETRGRANLAEAGTSEPEDDGASLEATELANRLRAALLPLGFRLEPLGRGQLIVHADMGRRGYRVLVQLLSRTERLDWADLLARRRASGVKHLAVVGDHRDLLRLTNPADLARATMWSWQALDRMSLLHRSVPLSPIELEAHFERDGLFEQGLQRLEATVAKRVADRGAMSEVLARLAVMRSPAVFLLEELAGELGMSRELALRILERLADTPFHLVTKVDAGEFVLRQQVSDALANVADYASSLRARLPVKHVERLVASGEPDLLTDADDIDHLFGRGSAEA